MTIGKDRNKATGVVGGNTINCDSAVEIGKIAMQKMLGKTLRHPSIPKR